MPSVRGSDGEAQRCVRSLQTTLQALGRIQDANGWTSLPWGQPLMFNLGSTQKGNLAIISIEQWPGWFNLRYHLSEEWEARTGELLGCWTACDDWGNEFDGVP